MPHTIAIGSEQTIYQAAELRQALAAALQQHDGLQLDLSCVAEVDCAGLQVLLWLQGEGRRLGKPVELATPSRSLLECVQLLGLQPALTFSEPSHGS